MPFYKNKVAVITGGASGIGRALGEALLKEGARVVLADINADALKATSAALEEKGSVHAEVLDVCDREAMRRTLQKVKSQFGQIDYVFNNAGIAVLGLMHEMEPHHWESLIRINIEGVVYGVLEAYEIMREQGHGHIVNTASVAGLVPTPGLTAYGMTKHAVVGLSESLRCEAVRYGVNVSAVCPGLIRTPLVDHLAYLNVDKEKVLSSSMVRFASVEHCAQATLRGVRRNQALIVITAMGFGMWWLYRLVPQWFSGFIGGGFMRTMRRTLWRTP